MKVEPIYHPFNLWEDHKKGFYDNISGNNKAEMINQVVEIFSDYNKTKEYMTKVINEWFYSCQHNLTNPSMNRIAYLGQAACCLCYGIPSTITMEAWSKVPKEYQTQANQIAESVLDVWDNLHQELLIQQSVDNKC